MFYWHDLVLKGSPDENDSLANTGLTWVDVRDLALAHVRALEIEEAGGERVIVSTGAYKNQDWGTSVSYYPAKLRS